jgi:hypothetical protein
VTPPEWQASIGRERHTVTSHISESYNKLVSRWSLLFKTKLLSLGSLGTPCHSVWVRDSHERWSERGVPDTDPLRSSSNRELRQWQAHWSVAPPSLVRGGSITWGSLQNRALSHWLVECLASGSCLLAVCPLLLCGTYSPEPRSCRLLTFCRLLPLKEQLIAGQSLKAPRPPGKLPDSCGSPFLVQNSVLYLLTPLSNTFGGHP